MKSRFAAMQNYDVGADPLDGLDFVRTEHHHLPLRRKFLDQATDHERRTHVQARKRFVEQHDIGIMHERCCE